MIDRSRTKEAIYVIIVFRTPAGRDAQWEPEVIAVHCQRCAAGKHHGGCTHAFTALVDLALLQSRQITAGDIGDGEKAWGGPKRLSSVSCQSIDCIALLTRSGPLVYFTGFLPTAPPLDDLLDDTITRYQQLEQPGAFLGGHIVELHRGRIILRVGPVPEVTEARARYLKRCGHVPPDSEQAGSVT